MGFIDAWQEYIPVVLLAAIALVAGASPIGAAVILAVLTFGVIVTWQLLRRSDDVSPPAFVLGGIIGVCTAGIVGGFLIASVIAQATVIVLAAVGVTRWLIDRIVTSPSTTGA